MRYLSSLASILLAAGTITPLTAQVQPEATGSFGSAVLGGLIGSYSGLVVSGLSSRYIFCPHLEPGRGPCLAPILVGTAAGLGLGVYAGVESSHRVHGAYVGAGLGALAGLVTLALFLQSSFDKAHHPTEPLLAAIFIGAAIGGIAGGVVAGNGDPARVPSSSRQFPIGIRVNF
jgi:hypothetical protein